MEQETQSTLDKYLELFEVTRERVGDQFVAMSLVQEIARDRRSERIRAERQAARPATQQAPRNFQGEELASQKQREWLRDLGIYVPKNCSRGHASELITEALAKQAAR